MRYTAELFSGALPRRHENRSLDAVAAECSATQTELGDLNDDAVAAAEVGAAASMLSRHGHSPADLAEGMIGALHDRQEHAADAFVDGWRGSRARLRRQLKELLG